jgi:hypothetical protein
MKSDSQRTRREQQRLLEQGSRLELVSLLYSLTAEPEADSYRSAGATFGKHNRFGGNSHDFSEKAGKSSLPVIHSSLLRISTKQERLDVWTLRESWELVKV